MTTARIPALEELLQGDLDYICGNLKEEFGRMAGQRLLITGGAGFLGYYLVHAALHFALHDDQPAARPCHRAGQLHSRAPAWLKGLRGRRIWVECDLISRCSRCPISSGSSTRPASSPPFYRAPSRRSININGLRKRSTSVAQARGEIEGVSLHSSSGSTATRPRTGYRRPRIIAACVVHRPACMLRRVCDSARPFAWYSRSSTASPRRWRAVQQRPRAENHTSGSFPIARRIAGRDIIIIGRRARTFCYSADSIWLPRSGEGHPGAVQHQDREAGISIRTRKGSSRPLALLGYRGKLCARRTGIELPRDSPDRRCPNIAKSRSHLGWPTVSIDDFCGARWPGTTTTRRRRKRSADLRHRHRLRRPGFGRLLRRDRSRLHLRRYRRRQGRAHQPRRAADTRERPGGDSQAPYRHAAARDDRSARRGARLRNHLRRGGTPFDGQRIDFAFVREPRARSAPPCATKRVSRGRGQEHGRPGTTDEVVLRARARLGQARAPTRRRHEPEF